MRYFVVNVKVWMPVISQHPKIAYKWLVVETFRYLPKKDKVQEILHEVTGVGLYFVEELISCMECKDMQEALEFIQEWNTK